MLQHNRKPMSVGRIIITALITLVVGRLVWYPLGGYFGALEGRKMSQIFKMKKVEQTPAEFCAQVNKEFPQMIDSLTRIDSLTFSENFFNYHYGLQTLSIKDLDTAAVMNAIREETAKRIVKNVFTEMCKKKKYSIIYTYRDRDKKMLGQVLLRFDQLK